MLEKVKTGIIELSKEYEEIKTTKEKMKTEKYAKICQDLDREFQPNIKKIEDKIKELQSLCPHEELLIYHTADLQYGDDIYGPSYYVVKCELCKFSTYLDKNEEVLELVKKCKKVKTEGFVIQDNQIFVK